MLTRLSCNHVAETDQTNEIESGHQAIGSI
jgi:hypothetical protein